MTNQQNKAKHQYGLLSMISIIIGTVIGSGIYVKNKQLYLETGSTILSTISWIIGGLMVLAILIAMIEVSSITKKNNEQGTLNNWTSYFWNPKLTKIVSSYFLFIYFPLVIASESIFSVNQLFESYLFQNQLMAFMAITIISFIIVIIIFFITSLFITPGKIISIIGTSVKVIPLSFIILIMFIILFGGSVGEVGELNHIFDADAQINNNASLDPSVYDKSPVLRVLLILPPILFAFDGFLYAASLSTEAKTESTYKTAAIFSIIFITIIFIAFSLSTFALADSEGGGEAFTISGVIKNIFPNSSWMVPTISIIIAFSILTATFAYATTSMWTLADSSNNNIVVDKKGSLIKRNKEGNPYKAGFLMLILSLIAIAYMRGLDGIAILSDDQGVLVPGSEWVSAYIGISDFISIFYTVINFSFYTIIILGAFINRFTKKVEVEKSKAFIPASLFAMIGMSLIIVMMVYDIGEGIVSGITGALGSSSDANASQQLALSIINLSTVISIIGAIVIVYIYLTISVGKQQDKTWFNKKPYQDAYSKHMTYEEYVQSLKD